MTLDAIWEMVLGGEIGGSTCTAEESLASDVDIFESQYCFKKQLVVDSYQMMPRSNEAS